MEVRKGYKQTDIGIIPDDWLTKPFKEISFMKGRIGWQGLNQREFTMNSDEPFLITGMNFKDGLIRWDEVYHVSFKRYEIAKEIQLKVDDILMTKDGTIGKLLYVDKIPNPGMATLNSHLLVFRPIRNSYIPRFLYYQLLSKFFFNFIELNKSGSTFFGISQQAVGAYNVFLPSIKEQTAIATALSDVDDLISSLEKLIEKKRAIKQVVMQKLLKPKKGWISKNLGEIALIQRGASPRPIDSPIWFDENSHVGWVRISDVTKSKKYLYETLQKLSEEGIKNSRFVQAGEIIMSICATIGMPIMTTIDVCIHDGFVAFYQPKVDKAYLYYYLTNIQDEWSSSGQTGSQMNLNTDIIHSKIISFPNESQEQQFIADSIGLVDDEITAFEQKLGKYKMLKQGIMQNLLTGKIRLI